MIPSCQTLTLRQAAQVLFATRRPTPLQLARVRHCADRGWLKGEPASGPLKPWVTTADSLAEFMASRAYREQLGPGGEPRAARPGDPGDAPPVPGEYRQLLVRVYREALVDRFLDVVALRRDRLVGRARDLGLIAAAVAAVLLIAVVGGRLYARGGGGSERAAVIAWLSQHAPGYKVLRWYPATAETDDRPAAIRVCYSYRRDGRTVEADRLFQMHSGRMTPGSPDEDDRSSRSRTARRVQDPALRNSQAAHRAAPPAAPRIEWD